MEVLKIAGFFYVGYDEEKNRFYAQTKFSMSSWSEFIEVKISTNADNTMLKLKSISTTIRTTISKKHLVMGFG